MGKSFRVGDRVVFTRDKHTTKPGPRAKNVVATPHGEMYEYQVDKYWLVVGVEADGQLVLQTRRGKRHILPVTDPRLRKAGLFERLFKGKLFPTANMPSSPEVGPSASTGQKSSSAVS